ncbi:putative N-acetyl-LL-diaminopimelate aminotransferase [compost metagenome]
MGQVAALEALKNGLEDKDHMVESYNQRRRLIVQGLRDIGLDCHEPQGAFYAFPSIKSTGLTSEEFAKGLLLDAKVAAVPGNVFGAGGEGYLRCSYATSVSQLSEALHRMGQYINKLKQG